MIPKEIEDYAYFEIGKSKKIYIYEPANFVRFICITLGV